MVKGSILQDLPDAKSGGKPQEPADEQAADQDDEGDDPAKSSGAEGGAAGASSIGEGVGKGSDDRPPPPTAAELAVHMEYLACHLGKENSVYKCAEQQWKAALGTEQGEAASDKPLPTRIVNVLRAMHTMEGKLQRQQVRFEEAQNKVVQALSDARWESNLFDGMHAKYEKLNAEQAELCKQHLATLGHLAEAKEYMNALKKEAREEPQQQGPGLEEEEHERKRQRVMVYDMSSESGEQQADEEGAAAQYGKAGGEGFEAFLKAHPYMRAGSMARMSKPVCVGSWGSNRRKLSWQWQQRGKSRLCNRQEHQTDNSRLCKWENWQQMDKGRMCSTQEQQKHRDSQKSKEEEQQGAQVKYDSLYDQKGQQNMVAAQQQSFTSQRKGGNKKAPKRVKRTE